MSTRELVALADVLRLATPTLTMRQALSRAAGVFHLGQVPLPGRAAALDEALAQIAAESPVSVRSAA